MLKTASTTTTKTIEWPHTTEATTRNERLTSFHIGHSSRVPIRDVRIKLRSSREHCPSLMEPNQSQPNKKKKNNKTKKTSAWEKHFIETIKYLINSQMVVLSFMVVTATVSHWERSALNFSAPENTVRVHVLYSVPWCRGWPNQKQETIE